MTHKYFAIDPACGEHETFETKDEAIEWANDAIDTFRDNACDGWDESVDEIFWGEIKQHTVITEQKTYEEAKADGSPYYNENGWREYGLVDIESTCTNNDKQI